MNLAPVEAIAKAVLYEGYILYPYRASNVKNQRRWTFGGVYPRDYARRDETSPCEMCIRDSFGRGWLFTGGQLDHG